jgi:hypothetical protein
VFHCDIEKKKLTQRPVLVDSPLFGHVSTTNSSRPSTGHPVPNMVPEIGPNWFLTYFICILGKKMGEFWVIVQLWHILSWQFHVYGSFKKGP